MDAPTFLSLAGKATSLAKPLAVREGGAPLSTGHGKPVAVSGENRDTPEAVRKAARQFESFFISYLFKVMKESVPDSPFSGGSSQGSMYEDMFGAELGNSLAKQGGIGMAEFLERHMLRSAGSETPTALPGPARPKPAPIPVPGETMQKAMRPPAPGPITGVSPQDAPADRTAVGLSRTLPALSNPVARALDRAAETAGVDPHLVRAVALAESGGNPKAQSAKGAKGLMQLMAGTARELGVEEIFDPLQNALGGARYLKRMLVRHGGDERLALASYNAGPGTVKRHGGVPPYRETRDYIDRVLRYRDMLDAGATPRSTAPGETAS